MFHLFSGSHFSRSFARCSRFPAVSALVLTGLTVAAIPTHAASPSTSKPSSQLASQQPKLVGAVTDNAGKPLSGATVFLYTAAPRVGTSPYCPSCYPDCAKRAATGAGGAFQLAELDPTLIFRVLVMRDGYAPTFVSKVDPMRGPMRVALKPLAAQESNPRRLVQGRIVDPQGKPVVGAVVTPEKMQTLTGTTFGSDITAEPLAITDSRGEFRFHGVPGAISYGALVEARGLARQMVDGLDMGRPQKTIALSAGTLVTGSVRDGKGRGLAGVTIQMVPTSLDSETFVGWFEIGTDKEGNYSLPNVTAGQDYHLMARMDGLASKNVAAPQQTVHLPAKGLVASPAPITVQPAVRVAGRVVLSDGKPLPTGTRLMIGRDDTWDDQMTVLKSDGKFEFQGVPKRENLHFLLRVRGYHLEDSNASKITTDGSLQNLTLRMVPDAVAKITAATLLPFAPEANAEDDASAIDLDKVVVKINGIGAPGKETTEWWDAQGKLLAPIPSLLVKLGSDSVMLRDTEPRRFVGFSVQNRRAGEAGVALRTKDGSYFSWSENPPQASAPALTVSRLYVVPSAKLASGDLMVGVALGEWKTVGRIPLSEWAKPYQGELILSEQPQYAYMDTTGKPQMKSVLPGNGSIGLVSRRFVAVTKSGEEIPLRNTGNMAAGVPVIDFPSLRASPGDVPADVTEFRLQTRPFEWTDFSVALEPKP